MKLMTLLSITLASSFAFANLGGSKFNNAYALRGNFACESSEGIKLTLDVTGGTGELIGQNVTALTKIAAGVNNGNAAVKFIGEANSQTVTVVLESTMGAKTATIEHAGKRYLLSCRGLPAGSGLSF